MTLCHISMCPCKCVASAFTKRTENVYLQFQDHLVLSLYSRLKCFISISHSNRDIICVVMKTNQAQPLIFVPIRDRFKSHKETSCYTLLHNWQQCVMINAALHACMCMCASLILHTHTHTCSIIVEDVILTNISGMHTVKRMCFCFSLKYLSTVYSAKHHYSRLKTVDKPSHLLLSVGGSICHCVSNV